MVFTLLQLLAVISTALYLVPTGAHLFELPNKIALSPAEYMTVQKIYAGWALFGIVFVIAIVTALVQAVCVRAHRPALALSLAALLGLVGTQVVFWLFTYPVNVASESWTVMPQPFEGARRQWEYSHAASAFLTFGALIMITLSGLVCRRAAEGRCFTAT
jgi:hypothetical protein